MYIKPNPAWQQEQKRCTSTLWIQRTLGNGLPAREGQVRVAGIQKNVREKRQGHKGEETGDQKEGSPG